MVWNMYVPDVRIGQLLYTGGLNKEWTDTCSNGALTNNIPKQPYMANLLNDTNK